MTAAATVLVQLVMMATRYLSRKYTLVLVVLLSLLLLMVVGGCCSCRRR